MTPEQREPSVITELRKSLAHPTQDRNEEGQWVFVLQEEDGRALLAAYDEAQRDAERIDYLELCIRDGSYQSIIHDIAACCHAAYKGFGNGPALRSVLDSIKLQATPDTAMRAERGES